MWSTTTLADKWLEPFNASGALCLSEARQEVSNLMAEVLSASAPRWLSLCGHSGTGKTMLAKLFGEFMRERGQFYVNHRTGAQLVRQWSWWGEDELMQELRGRNFDLVNRLSAQWLLVIDDLGFSHDRSGYATSALGEILNRRSNRWTLITSNLGAEQWAQRDPRIASRLIRDRNVLVRFDCKDYALRANEEQL